MNKNKLDAARWAKNILKTEFVILDTETTGLHEGEIVEIAIINHCGDVLLDTYVKPSLPIPPDATRIHGITDAMVADAPGWYGVAALVEAAIRGRDLVVYNAVYDRRMMHQSCERAGMDKVEWRDVARWHCAMERYARFWGDWNDWHQSYRWQTLTNACAQQNIPEPEAKAHSALGDCLRTLALLKVMAAAADEVQP